MLQAAKVPAHMKNVAVMDVMVNLIRTAERVAPFNAAKITNREVAVDAFILLTLALMVNTRANSPIISPKNTIGFPNINRSRVSLLAT